jgi:putative DNA primase/helicase
MRQPGEFDADQAETFLNAMFQGKPQDHYLLLWTWPDKRSHWCLDIDDLTGVAGMESRHQKDLYIGCGTSAQDYGMTRRCKAGDIAGIPGVWADIDTAWEGDGDSSPGPEKRKRRRAPDVETALRWARALNPKPTFIVNSGHGLHIWWKAEFWNFSDGANVVVERACAMDTVLRFQDWLRAQAPDWEIDGTHNLDRVLRLPGTWNWKCPGDPRPVELL